MEIMAIDQISPDQVVLWQRGPLILTATLIYTWVVMGLLIVGSWLLTRNLTVTGPVSRRQHLLETIIGSIRSTIRDLAGGPADYCLPFIGALFLFILVANLLVIVPGYVPPTSSLSTTAALALCVFIAVPAYGISRTGLRHYLKEYCHPNLFFFPLHLIGQAARTVALSVRLFGNMMSHEKIVGVLLAIAPLLFPVLMQVLGLVIGIIQAYIFAILSMVYIAAGIGEHEPEPAAPNGPGLPERASH